MLQLLDILLTLVHLILIGFNLLGWIWAKTRKLHLICILLTAFSWLVLGIWFGLGYCPVTDWQWQVKANLGDHNLPNSFIEYFVEKVTGKDFNTSLVDTLTAGMFVAAALLSVFFNLIRKKNLKV